MCVCIYIYIYIYSAGAEVLFRVQALPRALQVRGGLLPLRLGLAQVLYHIILYHVHNI